MAERDFSAIGSVPEVPSYLPGTNIEKIGEPRPDLRPEHVLFDFDGTLSLIREGWMEIMIPLLAGELERYARRDETPESIRAVVADFVVRLTGKQTIYQMIRLAEEISIRGGKPEDPQVYKERYHNLLMERIARRREALAEGRARPEDHLVPGSLELLEGIIERGGTIYIASGTDEKYVLEEAELLGLVRFAPGRIYGALKDHTAFSKEMVIRSILETHKIDGAKLAAFGDGYVEITDTKASGGFAIGVASDEAGRSGQCDEWKRRRLIGAGADLIVPDYREAKKILDFLWAKPDSQAAAQ